MRREMKKAPLIAVIAAALVASCLYGQTAKEEGYYRKGVEHAAAGRFEEAEKEFAYALQLDPFLFYASSCRQIVNDALSGKVDREAAAGIFKGIAYSNREEWDVALTAFDQAALRDSDYAYTYNERGITYTLKGKPERAVRDFDKAIALSPRFEYAYNNRAHAYAALGLYDKAIADLEKAVGINPYYAVAYYNLGHLYGADKGRYAEAIAAFSEAIRINPRFGDAYIDRGLYYCYAQEAEKSLADFDKAIALDGSNVRAWWNKAALLEGLGRKKEAAALYGEVERRAPQGSAYRQDAADKLGSLR